MVNLGEKKASRWRVWKIVTQDELDVERTPIIRCARCKLCHWTWRESGRCRDTRKTRNGKNAEVIVHPTCRTIREHVAKGYAIKPCIIKRLLEAPILEQQTKSLELRLSESAARSNTKRVGRCNFSSDFREHTRREKNGGPCNGHGFRLISNNRKVYTIRCRSSTI